MTTNSQLLTTEPKQRQKQKQSKQLEQEQNHRNGDHVGLSVEKGREEDVGKGTGNKKHNC